MILVVGGTGDLGGRVVRLLRDEGRDVRCLVRSGSDDSALREVGAEVSSWGSHRARLARRCVPGVTTVIATATVIARRLAGARTPSIREVDEEGMASLVDAAESAGVERFVYLSFPGVDSAIGTALERAKLATEKRLRGSAMRPVIVRADAFQEIHLGPATKPPRWRKRSRDAG